MTLDMNWGRWGFGDQYLVVFLKVSALLLHPQDDAEFSLLPFLRPVQM